MESESEKFKSRALDSIFKMLMPVFALLLLSSVLYVTFEVCSRYLFNNPHDYFDALTLYTVLVVVFGGAGITYYEGHQINMDMLALKLKGQKALYAQIADAIFVTIGSGLMTYFSWKYFSFVYMIGSETETSIPIPHYLGPMALLIGMFLVFIVGIVKCIRTCKILKETSNL